MVRQRYLVWLRRFWWAGVFIAALAFVWFTSTPKHTQAQAGERVITVYHDGIEQTIVTDATTVAEALQRAGVTLNKYDSVEPSSNTLLEAPSYDVNVYRARPVVVVDGDDRYTVMTSHTSAREIAKEAGVAVYNEDVTSLTRIDDFVADGGAGLKLTIQRATPMTLVLYGKTAQIRTQAKTVGDLMKDKNIVLAAADGTNLPAETPVTPGMKLEVWRNGVQTVTDEVDIPFTTKQIRDADQPVGWKQVQQPGTNGKKMVTYQVEMKNGQEVSRTEIQSVVTQNPSEQVEAIGARVPVDLGSHKTDAMAAAGIDPNDYGFVDYIVSRESGWCATKLQGHPGACPGTPPDAIPNGLGYGLCQSTPGSKMAAAGDDWQYNPVTQLLWCSSYAKSRYGSWAAAYSHWLISHNW